jgi:hypothetical protein
MAATKDVIFSSENVSVVHADYGTETVIVTFNEVGVRALGHTFWGSQLLDRMEVSAIGIVSTQPNWYPAADMIPAIAAARHRIAGRRAVTYGFSQGGYGALKFGAALSADLAIAFSPQWSIDPKDVKPFDGRFCYWHDGVSRNGEAIESADLCPRNLVVADPAQPEDSEHARRISALGPVDIVPAPFSGHETIRVIAEGGAGRRLIQGCLGETLIDAAGLRRLIRASRAKSKTYAAEKLRRLTQSRRRHGRFFEAALHAGPDGLDKTLILLHLRLAAGDRDAAAALMASIPDDELVNIEFSDYWPLFRTSGFVAGEARLAPLYRRRYRNNVFQRLHGVNSMIHLGERKAAVEELERLRRMPGAEAHAEFFVSFYARLDRPDLAREVTGSHPAFQPGRTPHEQPSRI